MSDVRLGFVGVVVEDRATRPGRVNEILILLRRNDSRPAWACPIRRRAMR